jgi:hypothetical protein
VALRGARARGRVHDQVPKLRRLTTRARWHKKSTAEADTAGPDNKRKAEDPPPEISVRITDTARCESGTYPAPVF